MFKWLKTLIKTTYEFISPEWPVTPPQALFQGVDQPTYTLANLICTKLLSPDADYKYKGSVKIDGKVLVQYAVSSNEERQSQLIERFCKEYCDKRGKARIYFERSDYRYHKNMGRINEGVVFVDRKMAEQEAGDLIRVVQPVLPEITFSPHEIMLIEAAVKKGLTLDAERQKHKEFYDNQQKAVEAIASLMGVKADEETT